MYSKINVKAFCLAIMIFYAIIIFIFSFWCAATGFGKEFIRVFESIHPKILNINFLENISTGKSIVYNLPAIFINLLWGLIDGLIIGFAISVFYNLMLKFDTKEKK